MMKTLVCLGNDHVKEDSTAVKACSLLKSKAEVIPCSSVDQLIGLMEKGFILVDVAEGIKKPVVLHDPERITNELKLSLHDFDAGFFLRLGKEIGILKRFTLIAIPKGYSVRKAASEIKKLLG